MYGGKTNLQHASQSIELQWKNTFLLFERHSKSCIPLSVLVTTDQVPKIHQCHLLAQLLVKSRSLPWTCLQKTKAALRSPAVKKEAHLAMHPPKAQRYTGRYIDLVVNGISTWYTSPRPLPRRQPVRQRAFPFITNSWGSGVTTASVPGKIPRDDDVLGTHQEIKSNHIRLNQLNEVLPLNWVWNTSWEKR